MSSSSAYPQPPQAPPRWDHTPAQVTSILEGAISASRKRLDAVGQLKSDECNFESVCRVLAEDDVELAEAEALTFYQYVAPSAELRDAAVAADKLLQAYDIEATARLDVFHALQQVEKSFEGHKDTSPSDAESSRLLEKLLLQRTRAGLGLPEGKRKEFEALKKKMSDLSVDFSKNFNEEKGVVWFSKEELEGVPEDVIKSFKVRDEDGKLGMTFKTPDFMPVMKFAKSSTTRKTAFLASERRLSQNSPIISSLISYRRQAASLLGYPTWAHFAIEPKMAKTPESVNGFLDDLREKLRPLGERERRELLELKKAEEGDGENFYIWDYRFYTRLHLEKSLSLDESLVKEYFPTEVVLSAILDIYQSLLGIKFFRVPKDEEKVWHEEVSMWAVWDSNAEHEKREGFLGYMHLDLFPREDKYSHAAVWGLIPGYDKPNGSRAYPVAAMVANLAKPGSGKSGCMTHDGVVTFFHEAGHLFHQLCSKTKYARFHGTHVARDFVEAPSQMLENWCWNGLELERMSAHYDRKSERLPADLIKRIVESRRVGSGLFNLRQLFFGMFDMKVHTSNEDLDMEKLWCDMRKDISLVDFDGEYTPGHSSFGHIAGGYDAGYYGYLYSQSFSADMYETVFAKDPMSPELGAKYRRDILRPGGSREEMDSLVVFLGREPNSEAFLRSLLGKG